MSAVEVLFCSRTTAWLDLIGQASEPRSRLNAKSAARGAVRFAHLWSRCSHALMQATAGASEASGLRSQGLKGNQALSLLLCDGPGDGHCAGTSDSACEEEDEAKV